MGDVVPIRALMAVLDDARADGHSLRSSWHLDKGLVVLSTWRGSTCVATVRLTPAEAAELSAHLSQGLAALAQGVSARAAAEG